MNPGPAMLTAACRSGLAASRSALGQPAYAEAWQAGRAMSLEQAAADALAGQPD